jgi:hypothetical protein
LIGVKAKPIAENGRDAALSHRNRFDLVHPQAVAVQAPQPQAQPGQQEQAQQEFPAR